MPRAEVGTQGLFCQAKTTAPLDEAHSLADDFRVLRNIGHGSVVAALVMMLGGHWALLQTVAWTNMLAQNLRAASVSDAVGKTFDGKHPCRLCKAIAKGKQTEKEAEFSFESKKLEFVNAEKRFVFCPPQQFRLLPPFAASHSDFIHRPPIPPPREDLA